MKRFLPLILIVLTSSLSSCNSMIYSLAGMKNPKQLNQEELHRYARHLDIPEANSYYADMNYIDFLKKCDTTKGSIKDHYQPMQALYFKAEQPYPERWFINCRAYPKSLGVDWNHNGEFNSYLPAGNRTPDSLITFNSLLPFLKPVADNKKESLLSAHPTILVFYCRMFHKSSRQLIREVRKNAKLANSPVNISYVNVDNYIVPMLPK